MTADSRCWRHLVSLFFSFFTRPSSSDFKIHWFFGAITSYGEEYFWHLFVFWFFFLCDYHFIRKSFSNSILVLQALVLGSNYGWLSTTTTFLSFFHFLPSSHLLSHFSSFLPLFLSFFCNDHSCPLRIRASIIESGPLLKVWTYNPTHNEWKRRKVGERRGWLVFMIYLKKTVTPKIR